MRKFSEIIRSKYKIFLFILIISFFGCSHRDSGIEITLPDNKHLEETIAGSWIKIFDLNYEDESIYITNKIHEKLIADSQSQAKELEDKKLLDRYSKKNYSDTFVWEIHKTEYPFNGSNKSIIYERIISETEGISLWITLKINPPGLPWSVLLPERYVMLKPNRKYEHAVTITSKADKEASLFLYGWGDYCTEISLF